MKIIQTFYNYQKEGDPLHNSAGFLSPELNWMCMALSCLLLKKHFGRVTLYCNLNVAETIIKRLKIPYDDVVLIPDFMDNYEGCNLWALPKIYTYSQQNEPFLHVDCDWLMFEKLSEDILSKEIIGQNIEYDDQYSNKDTISRFLASDTWFPQTMLNEYYKEPVLRVINAGIIGGSNLVLFKEYLGLIREFIHKNRNILKLHNDGNINSVYEQWFYYVLCKIHKVDVGYCTPGDKLSTRFDWMQLDFSLKPHNGYMHLLAGIKRNIHSYIFVSEYLRNLDPDLHSNIIRVCASAGVNLYTNFFSISDKVFRKSTYTLNEIFKRTLSISIGSEDIALMTLKELETILSKSQDKIVYSVYEFEFNKYMLYRLMNIFKNSLYIYMQNSIDMLWDTSKMMQRKISINKYVFYKRINESEYSIFLRNDNIRNQITDKEIVIACIPDCSMLQIKEVILFGLNYSIFNLVSKQPELSVQELIQHIVDIRFKSFSDDNLIAVREKIARLVCDSIQAGLYSLK